MVQPLLSPIEVVAAIIEASNTVLCVQRRISSREYISNKWEFPGGKIEPGEVHTEALIREIMEELRVKVSVGARFITVFYEYPDFCLTMHVFKCRLLTSKETIVLSEHKNLLWLNPRSPDFASLDWAAADLPIVQALCEGKLNEQ